MHSKDSLMRIKVPANVSSYGRWDDGCSGFRAAQLYDDRDSSSSSSVNKAPILIETVDTRGIHY
jgi:hypothetical protein